MAQIEISKEQIQMIIGLMNTSSIPMVKAKDALALYNIFAEAEKQ